MKEEAAALGRFLPEEVIHHIFSFLETKERAQVSVLSKNWSSAWRTYPNLEFNVDNFDRFQKSFEKSFEESWTDDCSSQDFSSASQQDKEEFQNYVLNTLLRYPKHLTIQELFLSTELSSDDDSASLDTWLGIAVEKGVKALELVVDAPDSESSSYIIPATIFEAQSLVELRIVGVKIPQQLINGKIMCHNIRQLVLRRVDIDDETFRCLIACCPLIDDLVLCYCQGLNTIKVINLCNLKNLLVEGACCCRIKNNLSIQIDAPSLENLELTNLYSPRVLEFHPSQNLKKLLLENIHIPNTFSDKFNDKFPHLEFLEINACYGFRRLSITSQTLEQIFFRFCSSHYETRPPVVNIDAPSITVFELRDGAFPNLSFTSVSHPVRSRIKIESRRQINASWFTKLNKLLSSLIQSQILLDISFTFEKVKQMGEIPSSFVAVEVDKLELAMLPSQAHYSKFVEGLFLACRPRTLVLHWRTDYGRGADYNRYVLKMLADRKQVLRKMKKKRRNQEFSKSPHTKSWQNDLTGVELSDIYVLIEDTWEPFQERTLDLKTLPEASWRSEAKIFLPLKWNASSNSSEEREANTRRFALEWDLRRDDLSLEWDLS